MGRLDCVRERRGVEREGGTRRGQHMLAGLCIMSSLVTKSMSPLPIPSNPHSHTPLSLSRFFMEGESHLRPQPVRGSRLSYDCNKVTATTATTVECRVEVRERAEDGDKSKDKRITRPQNFAKAKNRTRISKSKLRPDTQRKGRGAWLLDVWAFKVVT